MRSIFFGILFSLIGVLPSAAKIGDSFLTEKVFIAPETSYCKKGDNVNVRGQVLSSDYTDFYPYSRYLYLELINSENEVCSRQKIRINDNGLFSTTVSVGTKYAEGLYFIRAYTQFMLNRPAPTYPTVPLFIGVRPSEKRSDAVNVAMIAEGGSLVQGNKQKIVAYVIDANRRPLQTPFTVVNESRAGEEVASGETTESGLATYTVTPMPGDSLVMRVEKGGVISSFPLPKPSAARTLQATIKRGKLYCKIVGENAANDDDTRLWVYHPYFGITPMTVDAASATAVADLSGCAPGILTLWLTDGRLNTLSQRSLWVDLEPDSTAVPTVAVKRVCHIDEMPVASITDTIGGTSPTVRIVPEWDNVSADAYGAINFTNELISPIPFPANASSKDIDAWTATAKHAYLSPKFLLADTISYPYAIERKMYLSGTVTNDSRKPLAGGRMQIFNNNTGEAAASDIDSIGRFNVPVNDFVDRSKIFIQATDRNDRYGTYVYNVDELKYPEVKISSPVLMLDESLATRNLQTMEFASYVADDIEMNQQLKEITVTRKRITGKTMRELFHPHTPLNYIGRRDIERFNLLTVEDAIRRMIEVKIVSQSPKDKYDVRIGERVVVWRSGHRFMGFALSPAMHGPWLDMLVDGMKYERDFEPFFAMSLGAVESVELVPPSDITRCAQYQAPYGFIEIKSRIFLDVDEIASDGITFQPVGLTESTQSQELMLPQAAGKYRVMVDLISPDRNITSVTEPFEVK